MIQVAVMGYGTIGSGVVEFLNINKEIITKRAGQEILVKAILDLRDFPESEFADKIVHDFSVIEQDPDISIVVEAMGGLNPAYPFVKACLLAGKHVTTSNKALVAAHGTELLEIARKKDVNFMFEASVGGGIPIIRPLYQCLGGEQITEITGILNGTTNYILTKMDSYGETFDSALKDAQNLGYAERNPEADVEGHDTCRKIAILTALATGKEVDYQKIETKGITEITDVDFQYAKKINRSIKLLGTSRIAENHAAISVEPVMITAEHPLYSVNDVYNGIVVKGNMVGTTMFYGSGAGKLPTASAVVADILEIASHLYDHINLGWNADQLDIQPVHTERSEYFIRISGSYQNHSAWLEESLGEVQIINLDGLDEYAIRTKIMNGQELDSALDILREHLNKIASCGIRQVLRME